MIDARRVVTILSISEEGLRESLKPFHIGYDHFGIAHGVQERAASLIQPLKALSVSSIQLTLHGQIANVRQRAHRARLLLSHRQKVKARFHGHPSVYEPRLEKRRIFKGSNMLRSFEQL